MCDHVYAHLSTVQYEWDPWIYNYEDRLVKNWLGKKTMKSVASRVDVVGYARHDRFFCQKCLEPKDRYESALVPPLESSPSWFTDDGEYKMYEPSFYTNMENNPIDNGTKR